ncbi:lysophospholipase L1-like esterase [Brachybacterium muris]|uniref:SGNH/GDSL hydrolase family protein n=1 Tax=Brachybacterium muris TaxID=219301 RepID=UPI00195A34FD|nr:SGNH/GDSL hydrolase family protein [Brachybacterium muris]MBM7501087.1 lysophospholipase L1-like esterase [Brachybacterium muris]MCT1430867.1 SGNH/GDSL hydrolase family protein [Brachybacterium muris]MCT2296652.1 SGNH/GDSL hydrolase family protein [Brachybacterium muris]
MTATAPAARAQRSFLFLGDSITDCSRAEDPQGVGYGYVRLIAEHFAAHEPTARVINRGISGDRAQELVRRFDRDCLELETDVITIYIGVNDTWHGFTRGESVTAEEFERDYRYMLDQLSATRPAVPVLMVVPFVTDIDQEKAGFHADLDQKVAVIRDLAHEFRHAVVDLEQVMERAWSAGHTPASIAEDGVHPTIAGHRLIADAWLAEFARIDDARD